MSPSPPRSSIRRLLNDGNHYSIGEIVQHLNQRRKDCGQRERDIDELKRIVTPVLEKMQLRGVLQCSVDGRYQLLVPPPDLIDDEVIFDGLKHKVIGKLAETSLMGLLNDRLVAKGSKSVRCVDLKALNAKEGQQLSKFQNNHEDWIRGILAVRNEMGLSLDDLVTVTCLECNTLQNKLDQMVRERKIMKTRLDRYKSRI